MPTADLHAQPPISPAAALSSALKGLRVLPAAAAPAPAPAPAADDAPAEEVTDLTEAAGELAAFVKKLVDHESNYLKNERPPSPTSVVYEAEQSERLPRVKTPAADRRALIEVEIADRESVPEIVALLLRSGVKVAAVKKHVVNYDGSILYVILDAYSDAGSLHARLDCKASGFLGWVPFVTTLSSFRATRRAAWSEA